MTDYRTMFDKDFIGAWSLTDGKDVTVTITKVTGGTLTGVGGRKTRKPVMYMAGTEKGMALNATNCKTIATLYGNHVEEWAGKRVTLFKTTTQFGSETMECLRIRPRVPPPKGQKDDGALNNDLPPPPPERLGDEDQSSPSQQDTGASQSITADAPGTFNAKATSDLLMKKILSADSVGKMNAIEIDYGAELNALESSDKALYDKVQGSIDAKRAALGNK